MEQRWEPGTQLSLGAPASYTISAAVNEIDPKKADAGGMRFEDYGSPLFLASSNSEAIIRESSICAEIAQPIAILRMANIIPAAWGSRSIASASCKRFCILLSLFCSMRLMNDQGCHSAPGAADLVTAAQNR